jgi:predicted nucleotidyltransferase
MDNKFQNGPIPISDWTTDMKKDFWNFIVKTMREKSVLKDEKVYDILIAGSVARGDCRPDSDIDTVVLMKNLVPNLIKGYTDGYNLPYKDFLNFPIFEYWNNIPVQFCLADRLYDHSYNGYNISNFSLLNDEIVNSEIESDDDVFLSHYQKTKELTMGLDYNPNLKLYEDKSILSDIEYRKDRYESQISDISNSMIELFSNMNTGLDNTSTLSCLDLIPSDGKLKAVSFNTNCLLTEEIIDKFNFTNFLESDVKNFKVMNLSVGSHRHDSVISDKIISKFSDKFNCPTKIDVQGGWPEPFKIKENLENFYIKLTYDNDGLLDMFASKYVVMRDLFESNGLEFLLPKIDDEISIENSNFPDFVSKSLHYPGMSPYGFFDRESVLYKQYKKVDSNKYFEEFIIPDIYLNKNVMIRLYFIIGKVGTFLLSKNHFYHTIHLLKSEDGRYVWKYQN